MSKFISIPMLILGDERLTANQKIVFSLLRFYQGTENDCKVSMARMASELHISRQAVSKAIGGLERVHLVKVCRSFKQVSRYSIRRVPSDQFVRVDSMTLAAAISPAGKLLYSYLRFRMGENTAAWPHQKTIAEDLGCSRSTVVRLIDTLEKAGMLDVKHAHGGKKQGNRYRAVRDFSCVKLCSARLESGAPKAYTDNNTLKELKKTGEVFPVQSGLSESQKRAFWCLQRYGVAPKVAESIIYRQHHAPETVFAAIENAITLEPIRHARRLAFNIPAYIVGTLNRARSEGHGVRRSQISITSKQRSDNLRDKIIASQNYTPSSRVTSPDIRRAWIDRQKQLLGVA